MAAGHIVNGQCVDVAASKDVYWGGVPPLTFFSGADTYIVVLEKDSSSGFWYTSTVKNGDFFSSAWAPIMDFPACDTLDTFIDGTILGWGLVAAMVAAWAIHILRRAI